MTKAKASRLDFIDSLRGLAALYVLVFHVVLVPATRLVIPHWIQPFIMNGGTGVTLFFVISAFTLCYTLQAQSGKSQAVVKFYIRRVFRIVPLYYVWLLTLVLWRWGPVMALQNRRDLLLYMGFGFSFFPGKQEGLVGASWTLGVEMIFYVMFPLIFVFVTSIRKALAFLCFSILIAYLHFELIGTFASHTTVSTYNSDLTLFYQLPVFALGILSYFVYMRIQQMAVNPVVGILLTTLGAIGFILIPYRNILAGDSITWYAMAVDYSLILIGLSIYSVKFIVNRISAFYGLISYSVYLNHPVLVSSFNSLYRAIYALGYAPIVSLLACLIVTAVPLTALSYVTYRLIEKPGMSLGRELTKHVGLLFKTDQRASVLPV